MKTERTRIELLREFDAASLDTLFDQKVTAAVRDCAESTLERDRWAGGGIPFLRIGRSIRYRKRDVLNWLGQYSPQASTSDPTPARRQQQGRIAADVAPPAGRYSAPAHGAPFNESIRPDAADEDCHDDSHGDHAS